MKPYGMQIDTALSGLQAIDAVSSDSVKYNAIFMDHMMPEMDGIETTERIRAIGTDYAKNIPVIALTANAIAGNEKMFLSKGFQDFLSKPINLSRLDAVIRLWVRDKSVNSEQLAVDSEDIPIARCSLFDDNHQIDGVDLSAGLERFGGDSEAYLQVLRSYAANTRDLLDTIVNATNENINAYAITVHGIKGSSRGICANSVGDMAEDLEKAAKEGNLVYVSENASKLVHAVGGLIADLDDMFAKISDKAGKSKRSSPDNELLNSILNACKIYDMETVETAIKELEKHEYETGGELVLWLWENVQKFNVDEIIDRLSH
jgi:CheY-like chemotaxis protein